MGLVIVTAKVQLMNEEDLENLEKFERRSMEPESKKWVWRQTAIDSDNIKRVIAYNSTKSLILDYDGDYTMVKETFEQVFEKWRESKEKKEEAEEESEAVTTEQQEEDEE